MRLDEFADDPVAAYIKAERYLNEGSLSGLHVNTTSQRTQPRSAHESYQLAQIRFSGNVVVETVGEDATDHLRDGCLFVHPDMIAEGYCGERGDYSIEGWTAVAPTASGRTVLALQRPVFIKLAYIGYLGRLVRHISKEMVLSAREVTKQLMSALRSRKMNSAFAMLPELCGRVAHVPIGKFRGLAVGLPTNANSCYEWGVLFREARPFPSGEGELLVPFFSLFAQEFDPATGQPAARQDPPLLIQLFERQSKSIDNFLVQDILFPLYTSYFDALLHAGVELEAHAQNMLVTITPGGVVKRIVCRDFESAGRDVPLMERQGIEHVRHGSYKWNTVAPTESGQKYPKYVMTHSFMFDFKLGEYLVTPLIDMAYRHESFDRAALEATIRAFNRQFIDRLPAGFFPPDWCYYENVNWDRDGRKREYLWRDSPKYR